MQSTDLDNTGSSLGNGAALKTADHYCRDLDNPSSEIRSYAALQLRYFGETAAPCLCRALEDDHWEVRLQAVDSLSWLRNSNCVERIAGLLHDQNYSVAEAAAFCLEEILGNQALDYLWPLIKNPDPKLREVILKVAGAFPGGGREEGLFQLLQQNTSPEEASLCAQALAEMQYYPAWEEILRRYTDSEDKFNDEFKEEQKSYLASLTGDEEIMAHFVLSDVLDIFSELEEDLPWDIKKELRPMEKALRKHDFHRFAGLALEFSLNCAALSLIETNHLNPESLQEKGPGESLKDLLDLLNDRQRVSYLIISYFVNTPDLLTAGPREEIEDYLGLITCCMLNVFLESSRLLDKPSPDPGPEVLSEAAILVSKLSTAAEIIPRWLIRGIADCGEDAVTHLVGLLHQNDAYVPRQSAIQALSRIGGSGAVTGLLSVYDGLLESHTFDLCAEIDEALALHGPLALDPVIQYIHRKDAEDDRYPGIAACGILAMIRHPRSFDFLCARLSDNDEDVRLGAIDDLLTYGDPAAIPALLAMGADRSSHVGDAAKLAVIGLCENSGVVIPELSQLKEEILPDPEMWPDDDYDPFEDDGDKDDFSDPGYFEEDFRKDRTPFVREEKKVGRNEPCPCGSGKKYKKCCGRD